MHLIAHTRLSRPTLISHLAPLVCNDAPTYGYDRLPRIDRTLHEDGAMLSVVCPCV